MVVQESCAPASRSRATALFMLAINLFGTGLGPPFAGALSEVMGPGHLRDGAAVAGLVLASGGIAILLRLRGVRGHAGFFEGGTCPNRPAPPTANSPRVS
jgi:hypothetical protein